VTGGASASTARAQLIEAARSGVAWGPAGVGPGQAVADSRAAAVLVLFGVLDDRPAGHADATVAADLDVLLLGRATTLTHHAGQVSFPGGRLDPTDAGPAAAALREAVEETGLDAGGVEILGVLDPLELPVSRHLVSPVLAWWRKPSPVAAVDPAESRVVFRAPVADLLDPANRCTAAVTHGAVQRSSPAFLLPHPTAAPERTHLVWGFTALVLDRLFDQLGWTEPWDRSVVVPAL
jgi:8-oxo-dGTP pyrophosphatase MutT (NUDIX family)